MVSEPPVREYAAALKSSANVPVLVSQFTAAIRTTMNLTEEFRSRSDTRFVGDGGLPLMGPHRYK